MKGANLRDTPLVSTNGINTINRLSAGVPVYGASDFKQLHIGPTSKAKTKRNSIVSNSSALAKAEGSQKVE